MPEENKYMLKEISRDRLVFECICEFTICNIGNSPKVAELVQMMNEKRGLPNGQIKSVSTSTVFVAISSLETMGLISLIRPDGISTRSSGGILIKGAEFSIDINHEEVRKIIEESHENRRRSKRNSSN